MRGGNGHVRTIPGGSVVEIALEFRATPRSSHALVLAICLVFVRGMESRPPHAGPVSKLFLQSRRVALDPSPQLERSGPGGARSCVASPSWVMAASHVSVCRTPDKRRPTLIDPMRHVAWLAHRAPSTPSWLIRWPFSAHSVGNGLQRPSLRLIGPPQKEPRASVGLDCGAG